MLFQSPKMQTLASGLAIRQDVRNAVRPVLFDKPFINEYIELRYAHGGTLFLVVYKSRVFAFTCMHAFKDQDTTKLIVPAVKFAQAITLCVGIHAIRFPQWPENDAIDSEIMDFCILEFFAEITPTFFEGSAYVLDFNTVCTSAVGDKLAVHGVLDQHTCKSPEAAKTAYCDLQFIDAGTCKTDRVLRKGVIKYENVGLKSLSGISGAPVFNETQNALCGMVLRGTLNEHSECVIHYADMFDIMQFLKSSASGRSNTNYLKPIVNESLPTHFGKELAQAIIGLGLPTDTL